MSDDVNRVDSGQGKIGERTIELGNSVLAINNIGSLRVIDGQRNQFLTLVGLGIGALGLFAIVQGNMSAGLLFILVGAAIAIWNTSRAVERYLSIGTSDGRTTTLVSKDREFLESVRVFIRDKIDSQSLAGAVINISHSKLEGTFAIGDRATATRTGT